MFFTSPHKTPFRQFAECVATADQLNAYSALLLGSVGPVWVVNTSITPFSPKIKGPTFASGRDDLCDHNPNFRNQTSESIAVPDQTLTPCATPWVSVGSWDERSQCSTEAGG